MVQKTPRGDSSLTLACFLFLLAGCAAPTSPPTPALPPPLVSVTRAAPPPPAPIPPTPTESASPPERTGLSVLAEELFPGRLIQKISIPSIYVESAVVPVGWRADAETGQFAWDSPGADVGWVITGALPGDQGNIILYGHNNMYRQVFRRLADLKPGDRVILETANGDWEYEVRQVHRLPILGAKAEQLAGYEKFLQPSAEERLTLISCWPPVSNTHRVVVVAVPVE